MKNIKYMLFIFLSLPSVCLPNQEITPREMSEFTMMALVKGDYNSFSKAFHWPTEMQFPTKAIPAFLKVTGEITSYKWLNGLIFNYSWNFQPIGNKYWNNVKTIFTGFYEVEFKDKGKGFVKVNVVKLGDIPEVKNVVIGFTASFEAKSIIDNGIKEVEKHYPESYF